MLMELLCLCSLLLFIVLCPVRKKILTGLIWIPLLLCFLICFAANFFFFFFAELLNFVDTSDFDVLFSVASRLEKLYGGKAYVGLRIPDTESSSHQHIDLVLITEWEAVVVKVMNMGGLVSVDPDRSWRCKNDHDAEEERHPDPVCEARREVSILEAYLQQRGIHLPRGYFSLKVITSNPEFRSLNPNSFPPEVIRYDQWVQLKPERKGMFSGCAKGAFRSGNEIEKSTKQQLNFILCTAPMWDRLELSDSKYILGEFLEFKGKQEDMQVLRPIKRSKVSRMMVKKTSIFDSAPARLRVLYTFRDYRNEGASGSDCNEVTVCSSTEVLFEHKNNKKHLNYELSSVKSLTLSA